MSKKTCMRAPSLKPNFSTYINIIYIAYFEGQTFKYTSQAKKASLVSKWKSSFWIVDIKVLNASVCILRTADFD